MTLGDRIVIMKDGFIQQIGTPQEVFNHPKNLFVAGFIGSPQMNFLDGNLIRNGKQYVLEVLNTSIVLPDGIAGRLSRQNQKRSEGNGGNPTGTHKAVRYQRG